MDSATILVRKVFDLRQPCQLAAQSFGFTMWPLVFSPRQVSIESITNIPNTLIKVEVIAIDFGFLPFRWIIVIGLQFDWSSYPAQEYCNCLIDTD